MRGLKRLIGYRRVIARAIFESTQNPSTVVHAVSRDLAIRVPSFEGLRPDFARRTRRTIRDDLSEIVPFEVIHRAVRSVRTLRRDETSSVEAKTVALIEVNRVCLSV